MPGPLLVTPKNTLNQDEPYLTVHESYHIVSSLQPSIRVVLWEIHVGCSSGLPAHGELEFQNGNRCYGFIFAWGRVSLLGFSREPDWSGSDGSRQIFGFLLTPADLYQFPIICLQYFAGLQRIVELEEEPVAKADRILVSE